MGDMRVGIDDANGNRLALDSAGRLTANAVSQIAVNMFTEAATSRLVSGNTAGNFWTSNVQQALVGVNVTALTGGTTPTVQISLQQQDANGNWQTIASTAALNAVGMAAFSVGTGMTNGSMLTAGSQYRLAWTVTGTPATCTFQISVQGR